ncbi:hypothetical protein ACKFKG_04835 [Phormidesmis sp. 146-35]
MAYSDFTLSKVQQDFDLILEESRNLFFDVEEIEPSNFLKQMLEESIPLATAINTEKARSEMMIAPILLEVRRQLKNQISLFSGTEFNVEPEQGLAGFCDFIISGSKEQFFISAPVILITEAKNENIKAGLGQCVASMIAAQRFNQKAGNEIPIIYGVTTSGTLWRFITLEEKLVHIDVTEYYIREVNKILGILMGAIVPVLPIEHAA